MSRRLVKLTLVLSILATSLGFGLPKTAQASATCPDLCCTPRCGGVFHCHDVTGVGCVCDNVCSRG